jgi:hypothetical protein
MEFKGLLPVVFLLLVLVGLATAQVPLPERRSRMIIAPADRAALPGYAGAIKNTNGGINIASAYCYVMGTLAENTTLPTTPFCAPFNEGLAGSGVLIHPVIEFGGEHANQNFDKGQQFVDLFLPEAQKQGYAGYYFDVEYHGSSSEDRKYHEFLHFVGSAFNAKNISVTVLWRDSHKTPLKELNITGGVNSLSVEKEGTHCTSVRQFVTAMAEVYKTKGGTLIYPKSEIDNPGCITPLLEDCVNTRVPELGFFANFNDMSNAWWGPLKKWVQGTNTTRVAVDEDAEPNVTQDFHSMLAALPALTRQASTQARTAARRAVLEWQEAVHKW